MSAAFYYEGFPSINGTIIPDDFFDVLMPELNEPEMRVLLYIFRRTFGFKKSSDDISLRQMVDGITTHEGRVLDRGAGVSKASAVRGVKGLIEKGIIVAQRNSSLEKGNLPTTYAVRFRQTALPGAIPAPQSTPLSPTETSPTLPLSHTETSPVSAQRQAPGAPERQALVSDGDTQQTAKQQTVQQPMDDSKASKDTPTKPHLLYSAHISQVATDLSSLFHDQEHEKSNRTRTLRLWIESGLEEETFVAMMYEARTITQKRLVKKDATDGSISGVKNRMPYFFRVLEDLTSMAAEG